MRLMTLCWFGCWCACGRFRWCLPRFRIVRWLCLRGSGIRRSQDSRHRVVWRLLPDRLEQIDFRPPVRRRDWDRLGGRRPSTAIPIDRSEATGDVRLDHDRNWTTESSRGFQSSRPLRGSKRPLRSGVSDVHGLERGGRSHVGCCARRFPTCRLCLPPIGHRRWWDSMPYSLGRCPQGACRACR